VSKKASNQRATLFLATFSLVLDDLSQRMGSKTDKYFVLKSASNQRAGVILELFGLKISCFLSFRFLGPANGK
jgi:hypothetical protein